MKYCNEEFYNFKELCTAVIRNDAKQASCILRRQTACLFCHGEPSQKAMLTFLTSMNRGFYNHILYTMNLSLHQCCSDNCHLMHQCRTSQQFFSLAQAIMDMYAGHIDVQPRRNRYIANAKLYISCHLDQCLTLETVASHVFISKTYLSELFTAYVGTSFSNYITEQRIHRAKHLLLSTTTSIQDIAQSCGFSSSAYFSTTFTKRFGVSPRCYRNQQTKEIHIQEGPKPAQNPISA